MGSEAMIGCHAPRLRGHAERRALEPWVRHRFRIARPTGRDQECSLAKCPSKKLQARITESGIRAPSRQPLRMVASRAAGPRMSLPCRAVHAHLAKNIGLPATAGRNAILVSRFRVVFPVEGGTALECEPLRSHHPRRTTRTKGVVVHYKLHNQDSYGFCQCKSSNRNRWNAVSRFPSKHQTFGGNKVRNSS
jgi:hypothetical protein